METTHSIPSEQAVGLVGRLRLAFGLREDGSEKEDDSEASLRYVIYLLSLQNLTQRVDSYSYARILRSVNK